MRKSIALFMPIVLIYMNLGISTVQARVIAWDYFYVGNHFDVAVIEDGAVTMPDDLYSTEDEIRGYLRFENKLPSNDFILAHPIEWGFTDGVNTLTFDDGYEYEQLFFVLTTVDEIITNWNIIIVNEEWGPSGFEHNITSQNLSNGTILDIGRDFLCAVDSSELSCSTGGSTHPNDPDPGYRQAGSTTSSSGQWTRKSVLPIPSSLWLLILGLTGIGVVKKISINNSNK